MELGLSGSNSSFDSVTLNSSRKKERISGVLSCPYFFFFNMGSLLFDAWSISHFFPLLFICLFQLFSPHIFCLDSKWFSSFESLFAPRFFFFFIWEKKKGRKRKEKDVNETGKKKFKYGSEWKRKIAFEREFFFSFFQANFFLLLFAFIFFLFLVLFISFSNLFFPSFFLFFPSLFLRILLLAG